MKIRQIKRYRTPDYPTLGAAQLDATLLARIPARWGASPGFAAMLGLLAGFSTRLVLAGDATDHAADAKATVTQAPDAARPAPDKSRTASDVQRATSVVAPLLDEALQHDGRGAIGCVAMNPPTFLSEEEALELIRSELEAAGLKLKDDVDLDNVESPSPGRRDTMEVDESGDDGDADGEASAPPRERNPFKGRAASLTPQDYSFDLADPSRSVFIEYLSMKDHREWEGQSPSTVSNFDFPALARKVSNSFQKRKSDQRAVFGVFFDPLACAETPSPDVSSLTNDQKRLASAEYRKALTKEQEHLEDKAREKLRKQVKNFVAFLNQEGIVGKAK